MESIAKSCLASLTICVCVTNGKNYVPVAQLIKNDGYLFEAHELLTDDGYYLSVFRIPRVESKWPPVLVVHGLGGSAGDFVISGQGHALAYLLLDEGFDVWLLNCRGTIHSEKHATLKTTDSEFWNYSWHEIGIYDIPNTIDYILKLTDFDKILHIGFSQGTTTFYVMLSERPEYNNKILAHIAYAPSAINCHTKNALMIVASLPEHFGLFSGLLKKFGYINGAPQLPILAVIAEAICNCGGDICPVCKRLAFATIDVQRFQNLDFEYLLKLIQYFPAGGSAKLYIHYSQCADTCQFQHYKYSRSEIPKQYDLSNIKAPIFGFYGERDNLQNPRDTMDFISQLPNGFNDTLMVKDYGHSDFITAYDAKEMVYDKTIEILKRLVV